MATRPCSIPYLVWRYQLRTPRSPPSHHPFAYCKDPGWHRLVVRVGDVVEFKSLFLFASLARRFYLRPPLSSGSFRTTSGRPSERHPHRMCASNGLWVALLVRWGIFFPLWGP
jgi:hypothetical protein